MRKTLTIPVPLAGDFDGRYRSETIALGEGRDDDRLFKTTRISAQVVGSVGLKNDVATTLELVVCDRVLLAIPLGAFAEKPNGFDIPLVIDAHDTVAARIGVDRRVKTPTSVEVAVDYERLSP